MENPNNVKRSIRIPKDVHAVITREAKNQGISVNKLVIDMIKKYFKI